MTTLVLESNNTTLYELFESVTTAFTDMRDKATSILKDHQDITEACKHLDAAGRILDYFCAELQKMEKPDTPMPAAVETGLRLIEDDLRADMAVNYGHISNRLQQKMDTLSVKVETFFSIVRENYYAASDEDLNWYHALRDGTMDQYSHRMELTDSEIDGVLLQLESDEPNERLALFLQKTKPVLDTITRH